MRLCSYVCLEPARVRARVTPRTKAIIPVHFTGLACDIDGFDRITAETGILMLVYLDQALTERRSEAARAGRPSRLTRSLRPLPMTRT